MNPNRLIALAKGNTTQSPDHTNLLGYVTWCVTEHPTTMLIVSADPSTTPKGRFKILRGDRSSNQGWCVVQGDDLPQTLIITKKEFLRG